MRLKLFRGVKKWFCKRYVPDERYLKRKYKKMTGKDLNLQNPQTFTEKIQWLKLNWRPDILTRCSDKYEVRKFVEERVGPEILKELYGVYDRAEDIDIKQLPDAFVLKVNHGCGQNIFCKNKSNFDWKRSAGLLKEYLKLNRYYPHREWGYKNIIPRIICEEHLTKNGETMHEYQFYCYDGIPRLVQILNLKAKQQNLFDLDLNPLEVKYRFSSLPLPFAKPLHFAKMIGYASELSKGFPFARVDLPCVNDRVFFGEITFYPTGGLFPINPESFDLVLGSYLKLPSKKFR